MSRIPGFRKIRSIAENTLWLIFWPLIPCLFGEKRFEKLYRFRPDPWNYRGSEFEQEKYRRILDAIPEGIHSVIEIGCSEGVFTEMLLEKGYTVIGVDISAIAIERAGKHLERFGERVRLWKRDVTREAIEGRYDLLIIAEMLYYLGGPGHLRRLRAIFLSLVRGGGYLLLEHFHPSGKLIHNVFLESGVMRLLDETVYPHPDRDYLITLLQKRPDSRENDRP
ncbi:MAG TPA: SAM-dependent methyltransferase [Atribacteraceae bacterium]|nr:SAM-dependent methyltransferase [Atribacteraceae bacterium]